MEKEILEILALFWKGSPFLYLIAVVIFAIGMRRLPRTRPVSDKDAPCVTVLVSARNEAEDIGRCIDSLLSLDYPKEKLQVVLVNDHSTDQTGEIIREAAARHSHIIAVDSVDFPGNPLKAKARGIANGFKSATGDWVLITDADATVNPQWVRHTVGQLRPETGLAGGALVVEVSTPLSYVEKYSWAFTQLFNLGAAGFNKPFVCVGPNMAIRRDIYEACGGLEKSGSGVAEDLALLKMVTSRGFQIQTLLSPETTVKLSPVPSWKHLFSQQRRWFKGGIEFQPDYAFALYAGFWWGFFAASFQAFGWIFYPQVWLVLNGIKVPLDLYWASVQEKRMGEKNYARNVWVIYLYQPFIFMMLPVSFLFSKNISWMGSGYSDPLV